MKIQVLCTFKNGKDHFEKDDIRTVSDEDGTRFCEAGWVKNVSSDVITSEPVAGGADLKIDKSVLGSSSTSL